MINPFGEVNWRPGRAEKRKFAISLIVGFPCLAAAFLLAHWFASGEWRLEFPLWLAGGGAAAGIILLLMPSLAKPVYVAWYFLGCCIGFVVGNLLLGAFFYVAVTGLGLLMRALGKAPFRKGFNRTAATYWTDARPPADPKRYFNQF